MGSIDVFIKAKLAGLNALLRVSCCVTVLSKDLYRSTNRLVFCVRHLILLILKYIKCDFVNFFKIVDYCH